jgi:hypothetical protein
MMLPAKTTMIAIQSGISTIDQDQLITPNIFRIINIINTGPNIDLFFIFIDFILV